MLLLASAGFFFKINLFQLVLIWVKTACIGYQQKTVSVASGKERLNVLTPLPIGLGSRF